jgi:hypothetical protein
VIDWLYSKIALMVAALVIFSGVAGFFALQKDRTALVELDGRAGAIARAVNDVCGVTGDIKITVVFDPGESGFFIDPAVNGGAYSVTIYPDSVRLEHGGDIARRGFTGIVHLWKPVCAAFNGTQFTRNDTGSQTLSFMSGTNFVIERKTVEVSGETMLLTFVYV